MALQTAAVNPAPVETAIDTGLRPAAIVLDHLTKIYGHAGAATPALDRVSLEVKAGELVCLVGASGCGKSTLLNLVAGLDRPSAGQVERPAGAATLMFQDSALFPWLTVERNIELALRLANVPRPARRPRIQELLAMVRLEGFADKRPHELSGGMRQRVALARALAQQRPILLMDEPFGALDAITRDVLHDELERVWAETGLTILFVTHNVAEAVRLGDRVVVLSSRPGRVAHIFEVDAPRPRRIDTAEAVATAGAVTDALRQEVARHG
ncbi:MAG TPA: ABC transporter ATP-binding protein [Acidimicrobiales bacterium]|nr:ABC transporter ATP-binding protein [Acidimicrobiales bacterium]